MADDRPRRIHIALMAYTNVVPTELVGSLMDASLLFAAKGWGVVFNPQVRQSILPDARNTAVAEFIADPEATDLLFIDCDCWCSGPSLVRLVEHDVDVVAAPYLARTRQSNWVLHPAMDPEGHGEIVPNERGLLEMKYVGTGIMRIRRRVIEMMIARERPYTYGSKSAWPLFMFVIDDKKSLFVGEDYYFCDKWREAGGKLFEDPTIEFGHMYADYNMGKLSDWLTAAPPVLRGVNESGNFNIVNRLSSQASVSTQGASNASVVPAQNRQQRRALEKAQRKLQAPPR